MLFIARIYDFCTLPFYFSEEVLLATNGNVDDTMAEALGIVASALSIVGFAGQILQGCQNICTFLDSFNDAPHDLRLFRTEVKMFHSLLESYRAALAEDDESVESERWDIARLALDYSDEAVSELQKLVEYSDKQSRWKNIIAVLRKDKFVKHLGRLEKAKGYILASRTNMAFVQELKRSGLAYDMRETRQTISTLNSKFSATTKIMSAIPNRIQDVDHTVLETRIAVENLSATVSEQFAYLPMGINKMFGDTLQKVLQEFYKNSARPEVPLGSGDNGQNCIGGSPASTNVVQMSDYNGHLSRRVLKQKRGRIVIQTWFGNVFIHRTTLTTQETVDHCGLKVHMGAAKTTQTSLDVVITPCMLRIGLFCAIIWRRLSHNRPGFDMKLRVYNNVNKTAPIIQACESANIQEVQKLFSEGQASPFDRLGGKQSLLDIILERMVLLPMRKDPETALKKLRDLYDLFKMMVSHGLDPGQLWSHRDKSSAGPLPFLGHFPFFCSPEFVPTILDTARIIIEHSIQGPYSTADFTEILRFLRSASARRPNPVSQLVLHQEHWQVEPQIKETLTAYQRDQKPGKLGPRDAHFLRTWLEHGVDQREAVMAMRYASCLMADSVRYGGLREDIADQLYCHHLSLVLEFGINIQDDRDGPSVLATLREAGKLYQLRTMLRYLKWEEDDITELFETDLLASLVFQLAHLERRDVCGRALPMTIEFGLTVARDWNGYLERLDYRPFGKHSFHSMIHGQPGGMSNHVFENCHETRKIKREYYGRTGQILGVFERVIAAIRMVLGFVV